MCWTTRKKVPFWVEIRKLVNETEVGISNNYTGRHLAVQLSSLWQYEVLFPHLQRSPLYSSFLSHPSLLVLGNEVGNVFALPDLESWSVHSCSLMNNKYPYSEAQQPPLFKPPLPAMVSWLQTSPVLWRSVWWQLGKPWGSNSRHRPPWAVTPWLAEGRKR